MMIKTINLKKRAEAFVNYIYVIFLMKTSQYSLKWIAPTFQTMKVVANMIELIKTKENTMRKRSEPPGNWKVKPVDNPRLLSSNKLVGASGSPDFLFPLSLCFEASNTLLLMSALDAFNWGYRLPARAAFNRSLAVREAPFVADCDLEDAPCSWLIQPLEESNVLDTDSVSTLACSWKFSSGGFRDDNWSLVGEFSALSNSSVILLSAASWSLSATGRQWPNLLSLTSFLDLDTTEKGVNRVAFGKEAPTEYLDASWYLVSNF